MALPPGIQPDDERVRITHRGEGSATRYSMLETVRQYAYERLSEAGEGEATRNRHLEFYVALAEDAQPELVGRGQRAWFARLDFERENLLAAHDWCEHAEELAEPGLRLVYSLYEYWKHSGLMALGHRVTVEALARTGAQERNLARCRALLTAGVFSFFVGRYAEAKDHDEESLAIAREIRDRDCTAEALLQLGYAILARGSRAKAREHMREALAVSRALANKNQLSKAVSGLAELHRAEGELDKAEPLYEEALAIDRALGDYGHIATTLANLAWTSISLGFGERARAMVREGMAIADEIGSKRAGAALLDCATALAVVSGEWERAARLHGAAEAISAQMGYQREPADEASLAPFIMPTQELLEHARFLAAESAGRALSYDEAIAEARSWLEQHS